MSKTPAPAREALPVLPILDLDSAPRQRALADEIGMIRSGPRITCG
ncbi:MAG TPA: hypothetical protein VGJ59_06205 [Jatrophihabitantaceae bacterium]